MKKILLNNEPDEIKYLINTELFDKYKGIILRLNALALECIHHPT